ncbi:RNA polymerase I enhancer binding protein [Podila epigama]|nr:RNA polymerase I enhancer binding protein [Podila epigama]
MFHPQNNVGAWNKEDDKRLVELYAQYKGQWTTIGTALGRMADSCRDRYRNHLKDMSTMVSGPWQPHEDEKLLGIMQELALAQGKASILDSSPMWTLISERMGGTRTRHQCRHRYSQTLQPRLERGEWTGPSSAAAAAAAAVAANASSAAEAVKQHQNVIQIQNNLGLDGLVQNHDQSKNPDQDVLMLAAALHGAMPTNAANNNAGTSNNDSMMWTQAMTTSMGDGAESAHATSNDMSFSASMAGAALPFPTLPPSAPKGPIRRRGGLQQQLDVLHMILESGVTDHTEISWPDIAKKLRNKVQESNAMQLAKIIQTQDQIHNKKDHMEEGDSSAVAAAAAVAAMAAAVSAAQAEAVASLQRIPASNQIARTFMSSRCKTPGYRHMSLKEVVGLMIQDVERRINHRRRASAQRGATGSNNSSNFGGEGDSSLLSNETSSSSSSSSSLSKSGGHVMSTPVNDAAQQAALAVLSARFPLMNDAKAVEASSSTSAMEEDGPNATHGANVSQFAHDLVQQKTDRALAEKMLSNAFKNTEFNLGTDQQVLDALSWPNTAVTVQAAGSSGNGASASANANASGSGGSSNAAATGPSSFDLAVSRSKKQAEKQATRRVLSVLKSSEYVENSDDDVDDVDDLVDDEEADNTMQQ